MVLTRQHVQGRDLGNIWLNACLSDHRREQCRHTLPGTTKVRIPGMSKHYCVRSQSIRKRLWGLVAGEDDVGIHYCIRAAVR
jgi:hypothetical protein